MGVGRSDGTSCSLADSRLMKKRDCTGTNNESSLSCNEQGSRPRARRCGVPSWRRPLRLDPWTLHGHLRAQLMQLHAGAHVWHGG